MGKLDFGNRMVLRRGADHLLERCGCPMEWHDMSEPAQPWMVQNP